MIVKNVFPLTAEEVEIENMLTGHVIMHQTVSFAFTKNAFTAQAANSFK